MSIAMDGERLWPWFRNDREVSSMLAHLTGEFIASGGVPLVLAAQPVSTAGLVLAAALLASLVVIALLALPNRGGLRGLGLRGGLRNRKEQQSRKNLRFERSTHRWVARAS
jgi:hypothetical protein